MILRSNAVVFKRLFLQARIFSSRTRSESESFEARNLYRLNRKISNLMKTGQINEAREVFTRMKERNTVSWNAMISGYVRCREMDIARKLFDEMPQRDLFSWNLMISGYVSCRGIRFLKEGRNLFDRMPERDCVSWNTIITGYAKHGRMDDALRIFRLMPVRDVVSWNAMVTGFLQNGDVAQAVDFFERMPERDAGSINALVSGLIQNGELDEAARSLVRFEMSVGGNQNWLQAYNTLIAGYGHRGRVDDARKLFDQIPSYNGERKGRNGRFERSVTSWNTMIMCYVKAGNIVSARGLFDQMKERDNFSWNTMISGYANILDMDEASKLFGEMPNPDIVSWNTMISGYAQIGDLDCVNDLFDRMPQKNLVSWNSVITGYEKNEDYIGAIMIYFRMQIEGEKPDRYTLSAVLRVATVIVDLQLGMQIHQQVTKTVIPDVPLNNALITMYSRCGALFEGRKIFDEAKLQKEVIPWNAMIGGYASHGNALEALELFKLMKSFDVQPTNRTFTSVLHACAHAGLVEEGRGIFNSMAIEYGMEPDVEHYASLVDIVGRHGQLEQALDIINSMPFEPNKVVWSALIGAAKVHKNIEMTRLAAESWMRLEPESSAPYVLLYNMYADVGKWDRAGEVREMMERSKIKKQVAYSWVDSSH